MISLLEKIHAELYVVRCTRVEPLHASDAIRKQQFLFCTEIENVSPDLR